MSVVGAGSVGTAIAYACLIRGSADALALYDTNSAKVRAEVLDLNHGTQFTPPCTVDGGDDISVTAGSDLVVVTAGAKQHPGQSRLELAAVNVKIAQTLTEQLLAVSPDAVLLFVTNPVDVATYAAIQAAGPSYRGRIFGSGTVLDTARLRFLLATELGVAVENVHAFIVGEHGDSEIPLWSSATIGGVPATSFVGPSGGVLGPDLRAKVAKSVVESAYEIIEGKGATNPRHRIVERIHRGSRVAGRTTGSAGVDFAERRPRTRARLPVPSHDGWSCWCRPSPRSAAIENGGFGAPIFCPDIARGAGISGIVNICSPRYPTYRINK